MPATTETKLNLLAKTANDAAVSGLTLLDALKAARNEVVAQLTTGKTLIEARGEGVMARYELPVGKNSLRTQEIGDAYSELITLYYRVSLSLSSPTDPEILSRMAEQLTIVRSFGSDFSNCSIR